MTKAIHGVFSSVGTHPKAGEMFSCEHHDPGRNRALVRYGNVTACGVCAASVLASIALAVASSMKATARPTPDGIADKVKAIDASVSEVVNARDAPPEMLACAVLMAAFDRVSRDRVKPEHFHVRAVSAYEDDAGESPKCATQAILDKTHPLIPPDVLRGVLLEIDLRALNINSDETSPNIPGPSEAQ